MNLLIHLGGVLTRGMAIWCLLVIGDFSVAQSAVAAPQTEAPVKQKPAAAKPANKPRNPAYIDPAKVADPDFALQGEYSGTIKHDPPVKVGVQVVSLGKGKFQAAGYSGGLPGDGAKDAEPHRVSTGELKDGAVRFDHDDSYAILKDGQISVFDSAGGKLGTLKKVERTSPTMGAKPPAVAVVLFDGKDVAAWKDGKITDDGLLADGATSKKLFGKQKLHLEFRLPYQPLDALQGRGNSGVYLQSRYEVQVLDSFGQKPQSKECGGVYGIQAPLVNMCYPPLVWQTYDIDYTPPEFKDGVKLHNARITVHHNGVLIQKDVEIPRITQSAPVKFDDGKPGPLYLQDHGNPVRYRNIWIVESE
ncbi:MAG: DUF1080 domain-containing protein [Planctomycetota bacterium]|nr:DUF1080 domain-containing protein [Planctomycetota bacterium]